MNMGYLPTKKFKKIQLLVFLVEKELIQKQLKIRNLIIHLNFQKKLLFNQMKTVILVNLLMINIKITILTTLN